MIRTLLVLLFTASSLASYEEIHDQRGLEILSPSLKNQKSTKIRLANGLEAFIISDPDTKKAGAVLTVQAGNWCDPVEYPGMAHFLEHMLFLGTEEYPDEAEYRRFIQDHSGRNNAFTTEHITGFLFSIDPAHLQEALSRFSSFLKKPLFTQSCVERELKAIDQEHAKNIENDDRRVYYICKSLLNPEHPATKFGTGNSSTLKDMTPQEMRTWYENNYSAHIMRLIVIGKEPLEELKELVDAKFNTIEKKNIQKYIPDMPFLDPAVQGKIIAIEPVKDIKKLTFFFELPKHFVNTETNPALLLSYILNQKGEKSLFSVLKEKQLANDISTSYASRCETYGEFSIEITLTEHGLKEWKDVSVLTFQALNSLSKEIPEYLFNDMQSMQKLNYQFQGRSDVFNSLFSLGFLQAGESIDTFPERTYVVEKFDPVLTSEAAKALSANKAYIILQAKKEILPFTLTQKEKWHSAHFGVHCLPKDLAERLNNLTATDAIALPKKNPFIPQDFTQKESEEAFSKKSLLPTPEAILYDDRAHIFFAQEHEFKEPKCALSFLVRTPHVTPKEPKSIVLAELYLNALNDSLKPYIAQAKCAGLEASVTKGKYGININIESYSDTCSLLFTKITDVIKEKNLPYDRFSQIKNKLLTDYQNSVYLTPMEMSFLLFNTTFYKHSSLPLEKARILSSLTQEDLKAFTKDLFSESLIEGLIIGNLSSKEAHFIAEKAKDTFALAPLKEPYFQNEVNDLEGNFLQQEILAQGNATLLAIQTPFTYSHKRRAIHQILSRAIYEPFFSELRTKQQTGYINTSYGDVFEKRLINFFLVQSTTHSPEDLLARFERFIESYLTDLPNNLTKERFDHIKTALIADMEHPAKNLSETISILSTLLFEYEGDFLWIDKRLSVLKELSYEECLSGIRSILDKANDKRLAILLTGRS